MSAADALDADSEGVSGPLEAWLGRVDRLVVTYSELLVRSD